MGFFRYVVSVEAEIKLLTFEQQELLLLLRFKVFRHCQNHRDPCLYHYFIFTILNLITNLLLHGFTGFNCPIQLEAFYSVYSLNMLGGLSSVLAAWILCNAVDCCVGSCYFGMVQDCICNHYFVFCTLCFASVYTTEQY